MAVRPNAPVIEIVWSNGERVDVRTGASADLVRAGVTCTRFPFVFVFHRSASHKTRDDYDSGRPERFRGLVECMRGTPCLSFHSIVPC